MRSRFRALATLAVIALCITAVPMFAQSPTTKQTTPAITDATGSPTSIKTTPIGTQSSIQATIGQTFQIMDVRGVKSTTEQTCGAYFMFTKATQPGSLGVITLVATDKGEAKILQWATDKFKVTKVDGLKEPQVKILHAGGPVYPWGEITISPQHYAEAPCLAGIKTIS